MTNRKNSFSNPFTQNDFSKLFDSYSPVPIDMKSLLETQRKNFQALNEAQQSAIEGIQSIVQRQAEMFSQIMEDNSSFAKKSMNESTPEEKIAQNAEIFQTNYERTYKSLQELSDIASKSSQKTTGILNKRVTASLNEVKSAVRSQEKKVA